jgi:hypothetical protein
MKRWEIVDILKEILAVCGHAVKVEMVWLKGTPEKATIDNGHYEIIMRATLDDKALACIAPINKKYGLQMQQKGDLWVFTKQKNGYVMSTSSI